VPVANRATLDNIIEDLFYVLPIIHKKLLKIDPARFAEGVNLSRLHVAIMGITREDGPLAISEIAARLLISKPQMTLLINQLVKGGLVQKLLNEKDHRISDIALTAEGRSVLGRCDKYLKDNVREKLAFLHEADLEELSWSLRKLKEIGQRWERGKRERHGI
jgi:DNA-binding MarR family transcriptional regulator